MAEATDLGQRAKAALEEFAPQVFEKLEAYFDGEREKKFGFNTRQQEMVAEVLAHAKEFNTRKQKTLRAAFVYYGYLLGGGEIDERIWKAAMSIQMVHSALLMHDDFMDRDELRRGKPTTHKHYEAMLGGAHDGESMAVSVGDAVLCLGFEELLTCGLDQTRANAALQQMLRGITNTAYGQAYDVTLGALKNWTEEDVLALHAAKTAIYTYENPLFIGAHLAGLPQEAFSLLHDYSMDGGVAFQLQDDILGVYGDPEKTGKSADSDLIQGKCTLLVLKALQDGSPEQVQAIKRAWGNGHASVEELKSAKQAIKDSGSYDYSKQLAVKLATKAVDRAAQLRQLNMNSEAVDFIQGVAEYMVTREV